MASQSQLDLLLELHELEKTLKTSKGKARKEAEVQFAAVSSKIDGRVLKYYERHEQPFGEFRDRTCMGCGMIYPETHIHCRPNNDKIRLCESCGRILMDAAEAENAGDGDSPEETVPKQAAGDAGEVKTMAKSKAKAKTKAKSKQKPATKTAQAKKVSGVKKTLKAKKAAQTAEGSKTKNKKR
jgi:hypothetical protein